VEPGFATTSASFISSKKRILNPTMIFHWSDMKMERSSVSMPQSEGTKLASSTITEDGRNDRMPSFS